MTRAEIRERGVDRTRNGVRLAQQIAERVIAVERVVAGG